VGDSILWNPQGLSRPVMGLLYLYLEHEKYFLITSKKNGNSAEMVGRRTLLIQNYFHPLNAELNSFCHLLVLLANLTLMVRA
jgi:hypothetical protein